PYDELKQHFDRVMGIVSDNEDREKVPQREQRREKVAEASEQRSEPDFNFDSLDNEKVDTSKLIDDDLPWDTGDSKEESKDSSTPSSKDVDDWFSNLGS